MNEKIYKYQEMEEPSCSACLVSHLRIFIWKKIQDKIKNLLENEWQGSHNTIRAAPAGVGWHSRGGWAKVVLEKLLEAVLGLTEIPHFCTEARNVVANVIPIPKQVKQNTPP